MNRKRGIKGLLDVMNKSSGCRSRLNWLVLDILCCGLQRSALGTQNSRLIKEENGAGR